MATADGRFVPSIVPSGIPVKGQLDLNAGSHEN